jgi:HTH-type transcriptional regulator, competence development regulator
MKDAYAPERLGAFLRGLRQQRGWSLRDVEAKTGGKVHNAYLSQIESGKILRPSLETLVQLSLAFDIDFWTLATESGLIPKDAPEKPKGARQPHPHPLEMIPREKVVDLTFEELDLISEFIDFVKWRRKSRLGHPSPKAKGRFG